MAAKGKKGLGRGLSALFVENSDAESEKDFDFLADLENDITEEEKSNAKMIKLRDIEPNKNQPRKNFDKEKLEILSKSIEKHGVVQPILVKDNNNGTFLIIAGERRWRAAKMAGLKEIPCIVRDMDEAAVMEIALIENLQREDLNPIEEAEGYKNLMVSCNLTQEEVAERVGKSRSAVANSLRLNNLTDEVKEMLISGEISQGHGRALLAVTDKERQIETAKLVIEKGLNVRQVEKLVSELSKGGNKPQPPKESGMMKKYFSDIENTLESRFGTKVKISDGANKGKIILESYSKDDLERILVELKW